MTEKIADNSGLQAFIWEKAVSYLARRDYSTKSLAEKLKRFTHSKKVVEICSEHAVQESELMDMINLAVARAIELGYLDEQRFARMLVQSRQSRGYGPARIQAELAEHGIELSVDMHAELMDCHNAENDPWIEKIAADIKRRSKWNNLKDKATQLKIMRHFYGKGFSAEQIEKAINLILFHKE